jgi:16S rRNA U516 pseudouridylate synthase RsuA-like enzyme
MFEKVGNEVTYLKRTAIGDFMIGELAPGEYRELTKEELEYCLQQLKELLMVLRRYSRH